MGRNRRSRGEYNRQEGLEEERKPSSEALTKISARHPEALNHSSWNRDESRNLSITQKAYWHTIVSVYARRSDGRVG